MEKLRGGGGGLETTFTLVSFSKFLHRTVLPRCFGTVQSCTWWQGLTQGDPSGPGSNPRSAVFLQIFRHFFIQISTHILSQIV